jgi:GAF domain-containing protein
VVVQDVASDPIFAGTEAREVMLEAGARAVQSTPLVNGRGGLLGMLSTHYREPRRPPTQELAAVDLIARRAASSLDGGSTQP